MVLEMDVMCRWWEREARKPRLREPMGDTEEPKLGGGGGLSGKGQL